MLGNLASSLLGRDSVGGVLALAFSAATIYLWVTGQPVPGELLVVNTVVVQNYINVRKDTNVENVEVTLDPPYTGTPDDDNRIAA